MKTEERRLKVFDEYVGEKIALYGLSTETERVLPEFIEFFDLLGLLDSFQTEGEMYGQHIISLDKAILDGVELIIVIARPGSCKAIAKKIGDKCREYNVALFDIRGRNLLESSKVVYDFKSVKGYTYEQVVKCIGNVDAVSFDLFDTLVMRTVMSVADVYDLVALRLKEQGIEIVDFLNKRMKAEKQLSQGYAPKLVEIYERILEDQTDLNAQELAFKEYEIDKDLLVPRTDVIGLMQEAKSQGKKIYITTDTYYEREQIEEILNENGISDYGDLLVSCEYKTGKMQNLFSELKKRAGKVKILHIGDDIMADIRSARNNKLDCFQIYSGSELMDFVGGLGLMEYAVTLADRIKVGMCVATIFNSPFQFESEEQKIKVKDASDIGYLFCAPMINDFVIWFGQQVQKQNLQNVWFCARDGFLIKKIFEKVYPNIKSEYFLTSRISAIRAGVENTNDIVYVDSMRFSGTVEENLKCRFGIDSIGIPQTEMDLSQEGLLRYANYILNASIIKRANNQKYVDSLNIETGEIAFFDFVAKGTSQMYAQRLVSNHICGLYFLQLEPEYMEDKHLRITPFYAENERDNSAIFENYYILETLLTSPYPSIEEFDSEGHPIYAKETRSERDIACFIRAQRGILEYTDRFLKVCPISERHVNKKLDEAFLLLMHNVEILDNDFLSLTVEDPFFGRMTDIKDVL